MVPLGVSHPAAKVREEGAGAFLSKIPISSHFFPPSGSGQSKAVPDCPVVLGAPWHRERDWRQEEGVVLDELQVRGERGLGPTWKLCQGRGEASPHVGNS